MKYIALLYGEPDAGPAPGTPEFMEMLGEFQSATAAMADAGVLVDSSPLQPPQAATTNPAATSTGISGCREQLRIKPISLLLRLAGRKRVEVACHVALVQRVADDGGSTHERAYGGVGEQ